MQHHAVGDVMTREVVVAHRETTFKEIAELFHRNDITAVPVVDDRNHPIGIVSEADLIRKEAGTRGEEGHPLTRWLHPRETARAEAETADGMMTSPVVTAQPEWSLVEAARLMHHKRLKRLPVVDGEDRLVGIVSRCDLLQPFLRDDAAIRAEITEEILQRTLSLGPGAVGVTVENGVVTLAGTVERKSLIPLVERLCHSLDGVVAVHQALDFTLDDTRADISPPVNRGILGPHSSPRP